jgi:hypothetical protein
MAPQGIRTVKSSIISNMVTDDYFKLSGLKFGDFIFDKKYSKNMDKFTTGGLSSNILFRDVLLFGKEDKRKPRKYISIGSVREDGRGMTTAGRINLLYFVIMLLP